jgi:transcription antitermination factor NusG
MPILSAEPDRWPADLLQNASESGRTWWALHTKPRQEKSLARYLYAAGLEFYLPLISRRSRIRGRIVTSLSPLFTSYVFLRADRAGRLRAMESNRIVQTLAAPDSSVIEHDLRQIDVLLSAGAPVTPVERLGPGDEVEISSGPLAGLSGIIERTAAGRRFIVRVDFIQQGASVMLDDFVLNPMSRGSAPVR